jgi:hypothetical protein
MGWVVHVALRPRHRLQGNTKINFEDIGFEGVDWIHLAQVGDQSRAFVNTVMSLRILQNAGNFLNRWTTISFSRHFLLCGVRYLMVKLSCA